MITFADMEYYANYIEDAVIRVADDGKRYIKRAGQKEVLAGEGSKTAYGGEGFGVFYTLEPITKEQYYSYGRKWNFDESGRIKYFQK